VKRRARHSSYARIRRSSGKRTIQSDEAPVVTVGHLPADDRQGDHRHELHEADQPEIQSAVGQGVELPAHATPCMWNATLERIQDDHSSANGG
jgi:hypothetical protein